MSTGINVSIYTYTHIIYIYTHIIYISAESDSPLPSLQLPQTCRKTTLVLPCLGTGIYVCIYTYTHIIHKSALSEFPLPSLPLAQTCRNTTLFVLSGHYPKSRAPVMRYIYKPPSTKNDICIYTYIYRRPGSP